MEGPDPDADLMLRVAGGDRAAFERLYDRYASAAFSIAKRVCGDATLAEDVVQEAFLSVWRRPGSYAPGRGRFSSYLFGVVHNKAVDAIRHEEALRRREQVVVGYEDQTGPEEEVVEEAWLATRRSTKR